MTQTPDNNGVSSRLDQIEAMLRQTVERVDSLAERVKQLEEQRERSISSMAEISSTPASIAEIIDRLHQINEQLRRRQKGENA